IDELLANAMVEGRPDLTRYLDTIEEALIEAARRATGRHPRVGAVGEGTHTLWVHGYREAAMQLEHRCDEMAKTRKSDVLCAYSVTGREENAQALRTLCAEHTSGEIS